MRVWWLHFPPLLVFLASVNHVRWPATDDDHALQTTFLICQSIRLSHTGADEAMRAPAFGYYITTRTQTRVFDVCLRLVGLYSSFESDIKHFN